MQCYLKGMMDPTNNTTAVLVVDGSSNDVMLLQLAARECHQGVRFHAVKTGDEAKAYLKGEVGFRIGGCTPRLRLFCSK